MTAYQTVHITLLRYTCYIRVCSKSDYTLLNDISGRTVLPCAVRYAQRPPVSFTRESGLNLLTEM